MLEEENLPALFELAAKLAAQRQREATMHYFSQLPFDTQRDDHTNSHLVDAAATPSLSTSGVNQTEPKASQKPETVSHALISPSKPSAYI